MDCNGTPSQLGDSAILDLADFVRPPAIKFTTFAIVNWAHFGVKMNREMFEIYNSINFKMNKDNLTFEININPTWSAWRSAGRV